MPQLVARVRVELAAAVDVFVAAGVVTGRSETRTTLLGAAGRS